MADADALYGSSVGGVVALLPNTKITNTTHPSEEEVKDWLGEHSAEVAARVGDYSGLDLEDRERIETRARRLVHLATASVTRTALNPAQAGDDDALAANLWARYSEGLDSLVADVTELLDDRRATTGGRAGHGFPEKPLFRRDMMW